MDVNRAVSQNVRRAREEKKLTLDGAAAVTGVSRSMLVQIEKGDVNPTISVLWKIANGYKVSCSSLLEARRERAVVLRADSVPVLTEDEGRYRNFPAFTFDEERLFETYRILIEPSGFLQAQPHLAGTEEYLTVFAGAVEIESGEGCHRLGVGDSIRFLADVPHSYRNIGADEAQISMLLYYGR